MNALDALDLAHAEIIASLAPKLTARPTAVRDNPNPHTISQLQISEAFAAGIDHATQIARKHLARLEHITPPPTEQEPLEFETRHV